LGPITDCAAGVVPWRGAVVGLWVLPSFGGVGGGTGGGGGGGY